MRVGDAKIAGHATDRAAGIGQGAIGQLNLDKVQAQRRALAKAGGRGEKSAAQQQRPKEGRFHGVTF